VLDRDAPPPGLVAQRPVEVTAPQRDSDGAVRQGRTRAHLAQQLAGAAAEAHGRGREPDPGDHVPDVEGVQRVDAVDLQRQERAHLVRCALAGLVHGRRDARLLQCDGGDRPAGAVRFRAPRARPGRPAEGAGDAGAGGDAALGEHYRQHAEQLDAVLSTRDDAQLRVIADFLAELAGPDAGALVAPPPSAGGRGRGTTSSSGS
jgi:hypothetical protein